MLSKVATVISGRPVWCVADDDQAGLEALAGKLPPQGGEGASEVFLLRTPFSKLEWRPWVNLIAAILEANGWGRRVELDELVDELIGKPSGRYSDRLAAPTDAVELHILPGEMPSNANAIKKARENLGNWARLEEHAPKAHLPLFSQVAGGVRPTVYVLDDYNNTIRRENGSFQPLPRDDGRLVHTWPRYVPAGSAEEFYRLVESYCWNLNNLAIAYRVRTPKLWLDEAVAPDYRQVADSLPFQALERGRREIAAFVVDLEWKPTRVKQECCGGSRHDERAWSSLGYLAIHLLSQRFPEIPCFVYTGQWSTRKLQQALAHGAAWCFLKEASHHGYVQGRKEEQLTCVTLSHQLAQVARMRYGAFQEPPYREQLHVDVRSAAGRRLVEKLELKVPVGRCSRGRQLERLMSRLFADGASVEPVHVQESGRSKAQATFFVSVCRRGRRAATRFVKIGPWMEILKEYVAYQNVIRPRLNSYVANVMNEPVVAEGTEGEMPVGALLYSLAGLPERYEDLHSLDRLLQSICDDAGAQSQVMARVASTIDEVLVPLYGLVNEPDRPRPRVVSRPLWSWLGTVLPPVFTGDLCGMGENDAKVPALRSYRSTGYKNDAAWTLATHDVLTLPKASVSSDSRVRLCGFRIEEVEWGESDSDSGQVTLRHAELGYRVRLRGSNGDLRRRFGGVWLRAGFPVDVTARLDAKSREYGKLSERMTRALNHCNFGCLDTPLHSKVVKEAFDCGRLADPLGTLRPESLPLNFGVEAHEAPIHGDLNLQNILFAKDGSGPGWLIDFERAESRGMLALDLAKLEVGLWHHHLIPMLEKLAVVTPEGSVDLVKLLPAALAAVDGANPAIFRFLMHRDFGATEELLRPVCDLLRVVSELRQAGRRIGLTESETRWALAALLLAAVKFTQPDRPWRSVLLYLASAWHLGSVAPMPCDTQESWKHRLERVGRTPGTRCADGVLIEMQRAPKQIDEFTSATARVGSRVEWPKDRPKRWDFTSTGGVGDITPIVGYLWLMAKARKGRSQTDFSLLVPKMSAEGASCGTVDVLQAGGLTFPSSPAAIVRESTIRGGVLCRQNEELAPIDRLLMGRRRATNTMKNAALTYASILGKEISIGCTRAIVDVKLGSDTKMMALWDQRDAWRAELLTKRGHKLVPEGGGHVRAFIGLMEQLGVANIRCKQEGETRWAEQTFDGKSGLKSVRWFFTNAAVPQCRAIGRELILLHLEGLILEKYEWAGDRPEPLLRVGDYSELYMRVIPVLCGLENHDIQDLRVEWRRLRAQLRRMEQEQFAARECARDWLVEPRLEEPVDLSSVTHDLRVVSFGMGGYQPTLEEPKIATMDAYYLDGLFEWLCGDNPYDEEVGIWLHGLPGERMPAAEKPVISVFFRPSRTPLDELFHRVRAFLCDGVQIGQAGGG